MRVVPTTAYTAARHGSDHAHWRDPCDSATLVNGFEPAAGDRFPFMTFGSRTGFFGTTTLPPNFTVDQSDPNDLELVAGT